MEDVTRRAGMSRQALYRYVSGREDLVELAIIERCREFAAQLIAETDPQSGDVVGMMVDLMMRTIKAARDDEEFSYLAEATPRVRLNEVLASENSPVHSLVTDCFAAAFDEAERQGLLRVDVTRREMTTWLQGILTILAARVDQDTSEQRRFVREFAVRGLLK